VTVVTGSSMRSASIFWMAPVQRRPSMVLRDSASQLTRLSEPVKQPLRTCDERCALSLYRPAEELDPRVPVSCAADFQEPLLIISPVPLDGMIRKAGAAVA
jgi:hypothetical protein